jgi:hypothetical protein
MTNKKDKTIYEIISDTFDLMRKNKKILYKLMREDNN